MYSSSLLNESLQYGRNKRAEVVYRKCLRAGKVNLAMKIRRIYNIELLGTDDMIVALGTAMMIKNKAT